MMKAPRNHSNFPVDPKYRELNQKMVQLQEAVAGVELQLRDTSLKPQRKTMLEGKKKVKEAELEVTKKNLKDYVDILNEKSKESEQKKKAANQSKPNNSQQAQNVPRDFTLNVIGPSRKNTGVSIRSTPPNSRRIVTHH